MYAWLRVLFKTRGKKKKRWIKRTKKEIFYNHFSCSGGSKHSPRLSVWLFPANVYAGVKHLPVWFLDSRATDKREGCCVMIKLLLCRRLHFTPLVWTCLFLPLFLFRLIYTNTSNFSVTDSVCSSNADTDKEMSIIKFGWIRRSCLGALACVYVIPPVVPE